MFPQLTWLRWGFLTHFKDRRVNVVHWWFELTILTVLRQIQKCSALVPDVCTWGGSGFFPVGSEEIWWLSSFSPPQPDLEKDVLVCGISFNFIITQTKLSKFNFSYHCTRARDSTPSQIADMSKETYSRVRLPTCPEERGENLFCWHNIPLGPYLRLYEKTYST